MTEPAPDAHQVYAWLLGGPPTSPCDAFDTHIVASIVALAIVEAEGEERTAADGIGLDGSALTELVADLIPHAMPSIERLGISFSHTPPEEEQCLRELLFRSTTQGTAFQSRLAAMVARRAMRPNHLWQDLGLRNRRELGWLMGRHFEPLAARNSRDMKWKKFLYRMICMDEGFSLCTAPSCSECDDFQACFGEESGESLLARTRLATEYPA